MPTLTDARDTAGAQIAALSDGATAYFTHGSTGPWVVLVHGLMTPSFAWEPMADALAAGGYRVLRYDALGRGLSDRPAVSYDLPLYVRQLRELAAGLGIEEMHLVGWSMGGVIVSQLALESPDRVASLTLIAPGLFLDRPRALGVLMRVPGHAKLIAHQAGSAVQRMRDQHFGDPAKVGDYVERAGEQLRYPGVGESLASTLEHFSWNAAARMGPVGEHPRPVLIVWGEDDPLTPYAQASAATKLFPRAELISMPGGRHAPHLEFPEETRAAVLRTLSASTTP
ncbi:MAG: alpha/beta hydrolase [Solirubrobacteraceae bacterium]|nr:alpha/beta hydrolase [Solirubrobacteraceae bacterium]